MLCTDFVHGWGCQQYQQIMAHTDCVVSNIVLFLKQQLYMILYVKYRVIQLDQQGYSLSYSPLLN